MKNKRPNLSLLQLKNSVAHFMHPIARHFLFMYLLFLLIAVGVVVLFIALSFNEHDQAYYDQKEMEFSGGVNLNKDKKVVDHILQLQTAEAGPIKPNYEPSRDNPFRE